jgi:hypothetical protein
MGTARRGPRRRIGIAGACAICIAAACDRADPRILADAGHPLTGYLVVRAADCDTHLATLAELQRPGLGGRIAAGGAVVVGPASDSAIVRRALASYDLDVPVLTVGAPRVVALARLDAETRLPPPPSLVVVDRAGRVVLARASPTTLDALRALRATLVRLAAATR